MTARGPWISVADLETTTGLVEAADDPVRDHFELKQHGLDHIPWIADGVADAIDNDKTRMLALCPRIFELWWLEDYATVKRGLLDSKLKELTSLHVAGNVECASCVPYHEGAARYEGATDDEIAIVRDFDDRRGELPDAVADAIDFGFRAVYEPTQIRSDDIDRLRSHGYSDPELVELANAAFLAHRHAAINRVFNLGQS